MGGHRERGARAGAAGLLGLALLAAPLGAQNLNPRAYWPAPAGINVVSVGYAYATGGVLVDPSLPIRGGDSQSHALRAGYVRYFGLAGRTASLALDLPRADTRLTATLEGEERQRLLSGFGDVGMRLSVNLKGAPRMTPEEFRDFVRSPGALFGASLQVTAPTGQYNDQRFFNLGSNRWSARPEVGIMSSKRGWITELSAGVRFFTDNDDFVGRVREQAPIGTVQAHLSRYVRQAKPDFWFSLGVGYTNGGRTTIDGFENNDLQQNLTVGGSLAYPLGKGQALRFAVYSQVRTSIGEDSTSALVAYSKAWR